MRRVLAALAVLLLLTSCVPVREVPPPDPTEAEVEAWASDLDDWLWQESSLDDSLRPPITHLFTTGAEWIDAVSGCMRDRGYTAYDPSTAGTVLYTFDPDNPDAENLDWYECQATYQADPMESGLMGGEMLDYLYRYNTRVLVPCLETHGIDVVDVPTREQAGFLGDFTGWNPYYWMRHRFDPDTNLEHRLVFESCPAFPSAEYFDDVREIW